jgi:hypothetical protein
LQQLQAQPATIEYFCLPPRALLPSLDPLELLGGLWRRVSSMGATSSKLEKALADFPGAPGLLKPTRHAPGQASAVQGYAARGALL